MLHVHNRYLPTQAELDWANELLKDVLYSSVLNIKFKNAGLCPKYFHEMDTQVDYRQYGAILEELFTSKP